MTNIPYDNAKAINRTYVKEQRISKIDYRQRYQTRKNREKKRIKIRLDIDETESEEVQSPD